MTCSSLLPACSGSCRAKIGTTRGYKTYIGFSRKTGEAVVILTNSVQDVTGLGFGLLDPSVRLARMLR